MQHTAPPLRGKGKQRKTTSYAAYSDLVGRRRPTAHTTLPPPHPQRRMCVCVRERGRGRQRPLLGTMPGAQLYLIEAISYRVFYDASPETLQQLTQGLLHARIHGKSCTRHIFGHLPVMRRHV